MDTAKELFEAFNVDASHIVDKHTNMYYMRIHALEKERLNLLDSVRGLMRYVKNNNEHPLLIPEYVDAYVSLILMGVNVK